MNTLRGINTPQGLVVEILPNGSAYRYNNDGTVDYYADHKIHEWHSVRLWFDIPQEIRSLFCDERNRREVTMWENLEA